MININGERIWVPNRKPELIDGLKRMGIHKDAGVPLRNIPKKRLVTLYCRERRRTTLRHQAERRTQHYAQHLKARPKPDIVQLSLFTFAKEIT
jgi:hypothetical protein